MGWADGSTSGLKKPISKGQGVVIVHAGSEAGFVPNALLTFKSGTKSGDYSNSIGTQSPTEFRCCGRQSPIPQ
ncbi:unnamed protein product [Colias eurytheme]|nr:unnamed protein product [Colias eurytheme]